MNPEGIKRARVVLKNLGRIHSRLSEQEKARAILNKHLEELKRKPTSINLKKLGSVVETVIDKEKNLVRSNLVESDRVMQLRKALAKLSNDYAHLQSEVKGMTGKLDEYEELKAQKAKRQEMLSRKLGTSPNKQKERLKQRVQELERMIKNANSADIKMIRKRIASIKKQL